MNALHVRLSKGVIALLIGCMVAQRADAISTSGVVRNVPYVAAFRPLNSMSQPYHGTMILNFNNGIISGTYTDESIRPGSPLANRVNVHVSGGTESGNVHLSIGNVISFKGTMYGEVMAGSATIRGRIYEFEAHQGSPGHPPATP